MDENDMIVVVIGDLDTSDVSENLAPTEILLKTEPVDETDVMEMISTAQKHGKPIKLESSDYDIVQVKEEHLEEDFHNYSEEETILGLSDNFIDEPNMKTSYESDEEYVPEESSDDDEDDDEEDNDYTNNTKGTNDSESESEPKRVRRKQLSPSRRKSFVQDLKQEYPELQDDQKALIRVLAEIMMNVQKPPLPNDYFIMNNTQFECKKCGALADTQSAAGRHYQEYHGPRYLVCYACGVDFRSNTNLYKHEKRCIAPDATIVLKARALSLGRKGRSRPFLPAPEEIVVRPPVRRKTPVPNRYKCTECPSTFSNTASFEAHKNLHKGLRPYRCEECNNAYTSIHRLKRHQKLHSGESYVCDHCGRIFKVKAALSVHLDSHLPVPKFGCDSCPRRYATKAALRHHVRRVHLQLPPACACPICPKSYPRMSLVKNHMKQAHGMSLMTRRMFFKALPKMTDEQLQQAKEILKSNVPMQNVT